MGRDFDCHLSLQKPSLSSQEWGEGEETALRQRRLPPSIERLRPLHPLRHGRAVAMPSAGARGGPGGYGAEQDRGRDRKSEDDGAAPRPCNGCLGVGNDAVDPSLGIGRGKSRERADLLNEIGAVVRAQAAMT